MCAPAKSVAVSMSGPEGDGPIVPSDVSGGTNTSHTIVVSALATLLDAVPPEADPSEYERAVLVDNVLGKSTDGSRRRTFRYLRELYLLDPRVLLFRGLRDLWTDASDGRPLLAGLCALARDAVFRASQPPIVRATPGDELTSRDLAEAVDAAFPGVYKQSTALKIGRNTFSSWEQTGHLGPARKSIKVRRHAVCTPAALAYALLLGHLQGARGAALFESTWTEVLDQPLGRLRDLAFVASQHGLIDLRDAGGIVEVGFSALLRPAEGSPA